MNEPKPKDDYKGLPKDDDIDFWLTGESHAILLADEWLVPHPFRKYHGL
jgi:hypothetical protein